MTKTDEIKAIFEKDIDYPASKIAKDLEVSKGLVYNVRNKVIKEQDDTPPPGFETIVMAINLVKAMGSVEKALEAVKAAGHILAGVENKP